MTRQCGYSWLSPMRREWVRCEHSSGHLGYRHENGRSWVAVGHEENVGFPHRWIDADTPDLTARFLDKLRDDEWMYIQNDHGEICIDGWVKTTRLDQILNELLAEEKAKHD